MLVRSLVVNGCGSTLGQVVGWLAQRIWRPVSL